MIKKLKTSPVKINTKHVSIQSCEAVGLIYKLYVVLKQASQKKWPKYLCLEYD